IKRPSVINMINIHGESKRAIGKIFNFPFSISDVEILIDVIVTDANSYYIIIGNDWLSKVNTTIDWNSSEMSIFWDNKEIIVLVEFCKVPKSSLDKKYPIVVKDIGDKVKEDTEDEESEDEYKEEELGDQ